MTTTSKTPTRKTAARHLLLYTAAALFSAAFAGCNEFTAEPTRTANARAVHTPSDSMSPIGEVYDKESVASPLVAVNTGRPGQTPQVVTVIDSMIAPNPATRPAVPAIRVPTGVNLSANPADLLQVRVVQQSKPQDQFSVASDTDAVSTLTVTSPTGTGSMVLERVGDTWPATINLRLQNIDGASFSPPKTFSAAEVANDQQRVPLKVNATSDAPGKAQIVIPAATRSRQIVVDWTDIRR